MPRDETWVVDRIEGDMVVVEVDGDRIEQIPLSRFEITVHEGDVLRVHVDPETGQYTITQDRAEREQRLVRSQEQIERARAASQSLGDAGGDITL